MLNTADWGLPTIALFRFEKAALIPHILTEFWQLTHAAIMDVVTMFEVGDICRINVVDSRAACHANAILLFSWASVLILSGHAASAKQLSVFRLRLLSKLNCLS